MKKYMLAFMTVVMLSGGGFGDVIYSTTDRLVDDTNGDGLGDSAWVESFAFDAVGDSGVNAELRTVLEFDLSADKAAIANATNISFYVRVDTKQGNPPPDWQFVHMTEGNNGSVSATDFQAAGTTVGATQSGTLAGGTWVQFDVTSAVKADALSGDWSAFRLQALGMSDNDGVADQVRFYTTEDGGGNEPYLMVSVPEPSVSVSMLGGGFLLVVLLRWQGAGRRV